MLEHFQRESKFKIEEGILIIENEHLKFLKKKNIGLWQTELRRICLLYNVCMYTACHKILYFFV